MLKRFSVRDAVILLGLAFIGVGLFLFLPWVALTVVGALLLAGGMLMKEG